MLAHLLTLKNYARLAYAKQDSHARTYRGVSAEDRSAVLLSEESFTKLLSIERRRAERSRRPFVLMLVDTGRLPQADRRIAVLEQLGAALSVSTRATDICGWYENGSVIGIIFTELGSADTNGLQNTISSKVYSALRTTLGPSQIVEIRISFHVYPEDPGSQNGGSPDTRLYLYPDLNRKNTGKKTARLTKRVIDIAGSLTALILLSPVILAIALAIKLTSKGPILFKHKRVGQYGVSFTFLKFRSMYFLSDPKIHQEYVKQFISGKVECSQANGNGGAYKLTGDARITPIGTFLRRTSLDEIPQFFNVLRGDMSLVGPRPPIPYEVEAYDIWHRRRFLEVKPGITGLWQVKGRSRLKFDEMVRLDLKYASEWSLGLDFKILLATPRAVFSREGAW